MSTGGKPPPAKRMKVDYTATVNVRVGQEKILFVIYEDIFTTRSTFFRAACSGSWKQANEDIELLSDDPQTFNNYLAWIVEGEGDANAPEPGAFAHLIDMYVLADKLGDWQTANEVINHLLKHSQRDSALPSLQNIRMCYANSADGSRLRRLLVNVWVSQVRGGEPNAFVRQEGLPAEFILDVLQRMADLLRDNHSAGIAASFSGWHGCQLYHLHDTELAPKIETCSR